MKSHPNDKTAGADHHDEMMKGHGHTKKGDLGPDVTKPGASKPHHESAHNGGVAPTVLSDGNK